MRIRGKTPGQGVAPIAALSLPGNGSVQSVSISNRNHLPLCGIQSVVLNQPSGWCVNFMRCAVDSGTMCEYNSLDGTISSEI